MITKNKTKSNRIIRHFRIRKKVQGTPERLRLSIYPSHLHMEAQLVNDFGQQTVFGLSTKSEAFQKSSGQKNGQNVQAAESFGKFFAQAAKGKGIGKVVFDRGGFLYHGRIKAFADAARSGGLEF